METVFEVDQHLTTKRRIPRPHPPSWIDRLVDWINALPVPPWAFYLGLWLLLFSIQTASAWLDGVQAFGRLRWIHVFYSFYGVYFLAAIHYLDTRVKQSFETFRQILTVDEEAQSLLFYQLTTMPARSIKILILVAVMITAILFNPVILPLWQAMGFIHKTSAATLIDLTIFYLNTLIISIFIYHTLRQLSWISRIHQTAIQIDLFQLRPLYALSGLTSHTAGILLIVGFVIAQQSSTHGIFTTDPYVLRVNELFPLITLLLYSILAIAAFCVPLLGLHQLLLKQKYHLQLEADKRLQVNIQELHRRIDGREFADADAMYKHIASLDLERNILAKLPTWPWQPGTLNLILTAVLLPILLAIVQQFVERWAGG